MAIIKCIECGRDISSFAQACPHCGCPAEYQAKAHTDDGLMDDKNSNSTPAVRLKNQDRWDHAVELVKAGRGPEARAVIEEIVGKSPKSLLIISRIVRYDGLPVDFILEKYPDQAAETAVEEPKPTTPCSICGRVISSRAESCPHCGNPTGVHVCPSCGSTNTSVITGEEKGLSMFLFRGYSTNTVMSKFKCKDCGHKW